jgi:hypothetical protein
MEERTENFNPRGITSPQGDKVQSWGENFAPGGSKFSPRVEVKNGPLFTLRLQGASEMEFILGQLLLLLRARVGEHGSQNKILLLNYVLSN